jgi:leucyl/phenylalanyl-tRNA--protein transferase
MVVKFPPVELADETGLLAVGGDLEVKTLELAYRNGIFPWPTEGLPLLWFAPPERAILEFDELKIPKRLQRYFKKASYSFRIDQDFQGVIQACARSENRRHQQSTWITEDMIRAYIACHKAGFARSFEAVNPRGELVGGLYGVLIGKFFAGESMFYKEPNASKFVLIQTIQYLKTLRITWMDVQILTPFLKNFGAKEIARALFMEKLKKAIAGE